MATLAQNLTNLTTEMSNQTFTGFYDVIEPKEGESQDFVSITKFMIIHTSFVIFQFVNVFYACRYLLLQFWLASMPFIWLGLVLLDQCEVLHLTLTLPNKKKTLINGLKWKGWFERIVNSFQMK